MTSIKQNHGNSAFVVNLNAVNPLAPRAPGGVTDSAPSQAESRAQTSRPTVNLFDRSTYQAQEPVTLADGSVVALPSLSEEEASQARSLFADVAPEHQAAMNEASALLGQALMGKGVNTIVNGGSKLASSSGANAFTVSQASPDVAHAAANAQATYTNSVGPKYGSNSGATQYDSTVQAVAYMGVLGLQGEMGTYAKGMQATMAQQNTLRADQSELQTAVASWPEDANATQNFTWHEVDKDGLVVTKTGDLTKAQAQAALGNVQSALSSFTSQTQLQAMQLQNMSQNYQNGVNTISNLMKAAYDTTKNTVGNIHY